MQYKVLKKYVTERNNYNTLKNTYSKYKYENILSNIKDDTINQACIIL